MRVVLHLNCRGNSATVSFKNRVKLLVGVQYEQVLVTMATGTNGPKTPLRKGAAYARPATPTPVTPQVRGRTRTSPKSSGAGAGAAGASSADEELPPQDRALSMEPTGSAKTNLPTERSDSVERGGDDLYPKEIRRRERARRVLNEVIADVVSDVEERCRQKLAAAEHHAREELTATEQRGRAALEAADARTSAAVEEAAAPLLTIVAKRGWDAIRTSIFFKIRL